MVEVKRQPKPKKVQAVKALSEKLGRSKSALLAGYEGLTVLELTELRAELFREKAEFHVVKNNLAKIAFRDRKVEGLDDLLAGPTAVAFSYEDPVSAAKVLSKFAKDHEKLVLKGGWLEGKRLGPSEVKALASVPSRQELLGRLAGALQGPLRGLVGVLSGPPRKLVYALNAVAAAKAKTA